MRYLAEQPRAGCSLRRRGKDIALGYRPTLVEGAVSSSYNSFFFSSYVFSCPISRYHFPFTFGRNRERAACESQCGCI